MPNKEGREAVYQLRLAGGPDVNVVRLVTRILEGYATNGVFRGFSLITQTATTAKYRIVWHYDRSFELELNVPKRTLRFETLLTEVPVRSSMHRELKKFVVLLHSNERPDHRRVDAARVRLRCSNRGGYVSLSMTVVRNEFEYGTRKLVHSANEILMVFLRDGPYSEYLKNVLFVDQA